MTEITKDDLRQMRMSLIHDFEKLINEKLASNSENQESIDWLRSKAIRKMMNISPATLQNLRITGKIKFKKILGSYYYCKSDLLALFNTEDQ